MSAEGFARRASYGPTSPSVGERGARTRQHIIDVALAVFAERGVYRTRVDDIARAAGVSRATLYQYFVSKEALFCDLVAESGAALNAVARDLGHLGADPDGFDELWRFLHAWAEVYDAYATLFVEWAQVESPSSPLQPMLAQWLAAYARRFAAHVPPAAGRAASEDLAIAIWVLFERALYLRHTGAFEQPDDAVVDQLATVCQRILYPETPVEVLLRHPTAARPRPRRRTAPALPTPGPGSAEHRFERLSSAARATVGQLLDAGGRVCARTGYHGANVDLIATEAGLTRGTFYKYFDDKADLMRLLSRRCAVEIDAMSARFARLDAAPDSNTALRAWLADFTDLHRAQAGVFRAWRERLGDAELDTAGAASFQTACNAAARLLSRFPTAVVADVDDLAALLVGFLERFPDQAAGTRYERSGAQLAEVMAVVIDRGFLVGPEPR